MTSDSFDMDLDEDYDFVSENCGDSSAGVTEKIDDVGDSEKYFSDSFSDFESRKEENPRCGTLVRSSLCGNSRETRLTTIIDQLKINNRLKGELIIIFLITFYKLHREVIYFYFLKLIDFKTENALPSIGIFNNYK